MGRVQILSGKHAKRWIHFNESGTVRPTGVRARKVLFDWLRFSIKGNTCLDLFSGSGILAFEAMSHGAKSVHCIDNDINNCKMIESEAKRINEMNISIQCASIPNLSIHAFDTIFLDAPFDQDTLFKKTLDWIVNDKIVNHHGRLYIESSSEITDLKGFHLLKSKRISHVWIHLFERVDSE